MRGLMVRTESPLFSCCCWCQSQAAKITRGENPKMLRDFFFFLGCSAKEAILVPFYFFDLG